MDLKSLGLVIFLFVLVSACKKSSVPDPSDTEVPISTILAIDTSHTDIGGFGPFNIGSYWTRRHRDYVIDDVTGLSTTFIDDTTTRTIVSEILIDTTLYMMKDNGSFYYTNNGRHTVSFYSTDSLFVTKVYLDLNLQVGDTMSVDTTFFDTSQGAPFDYYTDVLIFDFYDIIDIAENRYGAITQKWRIYQGNTSGMPIDRKIYEEGIGLTYHDLGPMLNSCEFYSLLDYLVVE